MLRVSEVHLHACETLLSFLRRYRAKRMMATRESDGSPSVLKRQRSAGAFDVRVSFSNIVIKTNRYLLGVAGRRCVELGEPHSRTTDTTWTLEGTEETVRLIKPLSHPSRFAGRSTSFVLAARVASGVWQEVVAFEVGHGEKILGLAFRRLSEPFCKFGLCESQPTWKIFRPFKFAPDQATQGIRVDDPTNARKLVNRLVEVPLLSIFDHLAPESNMGLACTDPKFSSISRLVTRPPFANRCRT